MAIAGALLLFAATSFFAASLGSVGVWPWVGFAGVAGLYALMLRMRLFNELEGAVVCEILLILALLSVPAIEKLRRDAADRAVREQPRPSSLPEAIDRG